MSKVLVLNGNPKRDSLCKRLAESYAQGSVSGGSDVKIIHISDLDFDINLKEGYAEIPPLEYDLSILQNAIQESSHIVIVSPTWWGTIPAKLKGVFDRVFLPGFAFEYKDGKSMPEKLLKGKTSRIIVTMDTPVWYYRLILGDPIIKNLKKPTLEFCGIKVKKISRFGPVISSTDATRKKWIQSVMKAGIEDSAVKKAHNRVAGGFSPPAPTSPGMRVRTGRFKEPTGPWPGSECSPIDL